MYGAKYRQSDIEEYLNVGEWQVLTYTGIESVLNDSEYRAADENETVGTCLVHVCMQGGVMESVLQVRTYYGRDVAILERYI